MNTRIVINPEILVRSVTRDGKPIIEGTRLSVEHVLGLLASGMSGVCFVRAETRRAHASLME